MVFCSFGLTFKTLCLTLSLTEPVDFQGQIELQEETKKRRHIDCIQYFNIQDVQARVEHKKIYFEKCLGEHFFVHTITVSGVQSGSTFFRISYFVFH